MTEDTAGKVAVVTERAKPQLVPLAGRTVSSDLRWHHDLMADHVLEVGQHSWITVGELAKVAYGSSTIDNKRRVRQRLPRLFTELLHRGHGLSRTFENRRGRVAAVKLFNPASVEERQAMERKLDQLKRSAGTSEEKWRRADELFAGWFQEVGEAT